MASERVVAVGFLSKHDLKILGEGFKRHVPVIDDDVLDDLLRVLDDIEVEPLGKGVVLRRH